MFRPPRQREEIYITSETPLFASTHISESPPAGQERGNYNWTVRNRRQSYSLSGHALGDGSIS